MTLLIENASTSRVRPLTDTLDVATNANFSALTREPLALAPAASVR